MKHNNVIPNVHLRKHWQKRVRTFFNQPAQKRSRLLKRQAKLQQLYPRPLERLRPIVRGQTVRYNKSEKVGRGFSLAELKEAKITAQFARSIGISVDHRRRNISQDALTQNVNRLKAYISKLVLLPKTANKPKKGLVNDTVEKVELKQDRSIVVMKPVPKSSRVKHAKIDKKMKDTNVYRTLRQEWANARLQGKRAKKNEKKE